MRIGTVTTGEPGTNAEVTNSGNEKDAVFDFVIPRGETGSGAGTPQQWLSAYSTPPQPGTDNSAFIFDRNSGSYGNAIAHAENSTEFTIEEPGYYFVSFHGTIGPASGVNFPLSIITSLQQQGTIVAGASVRHTFQTSSDSANISFAQILTVSSAPTVIEVVGEGGNFLYLEISISIIKIGNIS